MRYYKSIGLGFKTPKEAIEGSYVDKKCPFTGNVSIRGRILKAMVISTKMKRTVVIRRDYLQYVSKYRRFEKRHKNVSVHCSPCFLNVREGDVVTVGQCRPLAKTVRFNVLEHQPSVNKVSNQLLLIYLSTTKTELWIEWDKSTSFFFLFPSSCCNSLLKSNNPKVFTLRCAL